MINFFKNKYKQFGLKDFKQRNKLIFHEKLSKKITFRILKKIAFIILPGLISYKIYIYYLKNDPKFLRK
jgi:hypothetical protein